MLILRTISRRLTWAGLSVTLLILLLTVSASAALVNRKISGVMPAFGSVNNFQISPDGSRVVYTADQETDDTEALFSTPIDGSSLPLRLNEPLPLEQYFDTFAVSPDSSRAVYLAPSSNFSLELYSAPLDGSSPAIPLNGPLVSGGEVRSFQISPDSSRVIYLAGQDTADVTELYSAPLGGGSLPLKLNGPLVSGGDVVDFQISPDNSRVVYSADQDTDTVTELYSVPLEGGTLPTKLNGPMVSNGDVVDFQISPDSSRVVYWADQDIDEVDELYSVPAEGGVTPVKLNGPLVTGGRTNADFQISPDSSLVVYTADQDTDEIFELFITYEQQPALNFTPTFATTPEEAGSITAIVQLSETLSNDVQVDYAVSGGTATGGGVDYHIAGGTLLFAPGVITQPVEITITDDGEQEANETVVISLSNPQNVVLGAAAVFTLTIADNDSPGSGAPAVPVYLPVVIRE